MGKKANEKRKWPRKKRRDSEQVKTLRQSEEGVGTKEGVQKRKTPAQGGAGGCQKKKKKRGGGGGVRR